MWKRKLKFVVMFVLLLVPTLCLGSTNGLALSSRAEGVAATVEEVSLPFVTLRNKTGATEPSKYFGGKRGELFAGVATVAFEPIWGLEDISGSIPFYIPDEKIELTRIGRVGIEDVYEEVEKFSKKDNGNVVVYFHGYNIDFEKGCRRAAIFQKSLGLQERLLYFSWPADGNMLKYTWDEADLAWSVVHMARFIDRLVEKAGSGKIDIVAHSLGSRGAVQALVRLAYREWEEPIVDNLVLIAPDIDADVFLQELHLLQKVSRQITVYVSENDRALRLSQEVHGASRLGEAGDDLTVIEGVDTIDLSKINNKRISGHLYHLFDKEVIEDLTALLFSGKKAAEREGLEPQKKDDLVYYRLLPSDDE